MISRKDFYGNFEEEIDFIENMLKKEDLTSSETVAVSGMERRLADLESKKLRLQSQMDDVEEQINKINAQIARMKAT